MQRLTYATAAVTVHDEGGLVMATVRGEITQSVAQRLIADSRSWARRPMAQVVCYAQADLALDTAELFHAALCAKPAAAEVPTALIVQPDRLEMFRDYCQLHLDRGVVKAAFVEVEAARKWAAEQARVREFWVRAARGCAASP